MEKQVMKNALAMTIMLMLVISFSSWTTTNAKSSDVVKGLSWEFYRRSCPDVEKIVWEHIENFLNHDITEAAGLLRLHFHDCFVQGCDGSILLNSTSGELVTPPNLSIRATALAIINDIKEALEAVCPGTVSCADIVTLAARDSVKKAGGPWYNVPLGRRDSLEFANRSVTLANLPPPSADVTGLMSIFSTKGLSTTDLVSLSGAHTIGRANCSSFRNRMFNNTVQQRDVSMDQSFAKRLYQICPSSSTVNTTVNDIRTPNVFDNKYYIDLLNRQTLFTSDQSLHTDSRTKALAMSFALDQRKFFEEFGRSMVKMGQLHAPIGSQGEIRKRCWTVNPTEHSIIQQDDDGDDDDDVPSVSSS